MSQRLEGGEMQGGSQLPKGAVEVSQVSRHPAAPYPRIGEPRIKSQGTLQPAFRFFEAVREDQRAAAQGHRQGVVGSELVGLVSQPAGPIAICSGPRAESM